MSHKNKERKEIFAVLRFDGFHSDTTTPAQRVTVKEVVRNKEIAEAEVARLNALNGDKNVLHWWQMTRLFPEGRSFGATSD